MQNRWSLHWQRCLAKAVITPLVAVMLLTSSYGPVFANPTGGTVTSGAATIATGTNTMTVTQTTNQVAINWQDFGIGVGETVNFVQPSASAVALNRVVGNDASNIYGVLTANGRVFLINPNGILFAPGSQVNVGGLVASTLNLTDSDLVDGNYVFKKEGGTGSVVNRGAIVGADGGSAADHVVFLGQQVSNGGSIAARVTGLAAGNQVSLDFSGDKLLNLTVDTAAAGSRVANSGTITAPGGLVLMTTGTKDALLDTVVNNTGVIRAQTVSTEGGQIMLIGSTVNVGGTLDASAPSGGDGGFIETSGAKVKVADDAHLTTLAASGKNGKWLIDPDGFTIAATGGDVTPAFLEEYLQTEGDAEIWSIVGSGSDGNINVNGAITWSTNALILVASNDVNINAPLTPNGTASLYLSANNDVNVNAAVTANDAASLDLGAANAINVNAVMTMNDTTSLSLYTDSDEINMGLGGDGFYGRIDFPGRSGSGFLSINDTDVTLITDEAGLQGMGGGNSFALGADLDVSATQTWNAGAGFAPIAGFWGEFNGLGHTIDGLYINSTDQNVGLFRVSTGMVRNVGLTNADVTATSANAAQVGALMGNNGGTVANAFVTGTVTGTSTSSTLEAGGLAGGNLGGVIKRSWSAATVNGTSRLTGYVGGLVGYNDNATMIDSYSTGTVTGANLPGTASGLMVGGLVGSINAGGVVERVYSTGAVTASGTDEVRVGGLAGENYVTLTDSYSTGAVTGSGEWLVRAGGLTGINFGSIVDSYSTGAVSGSASSSENLLVGGLVGTNGGSVTSSYWNEDTSGLATSDGGTGLTTAQMKQAASFSGWDLATAGGSSSAWRMYDGYSNPLLRSFLTPITVTANDVTRTYDGTTYSGNAGVSYSTAPSGLLLGTPDYEGTAQGARNAGTYSITPTGLYSTDQQGYDVTYVSGTLTIDPRALTVTADDKTKTQGQANPAFTVTYSGLVTGDTPASLTGDLTFTSAADSTSPAGNYAIDLSGTLDSPNYTVTYVDGVLTVSAAANPPAYTGAVGTAGQFGPSGNIGGSGSGSVAGDNSLGGGLLGGGLLGSGNGPGANGFFTIVGGGINAGGLNTSGLGQDGQEQQ